MWKTMMALLSPQIQTTAVRWVKLLLNLVYSDQILNDSEHATYLPVSITQTTELLH
jgi:hypothetical protein